MAAAAGGRDAARAVVMGTVPGAYISVISPPYLPHISRRSRLDLPVVTGTVPRALGLRLRLRLRLRLELRLRLRLGLTLLSPSSYPYPYP